MQGHAFRAVPSLAGRPLTVIERRVIARTAAGDTVAEIAETLGLHPSSVRRRREKIAEKLGARNTLHSVAIWLGRAALERLTE